MSRAEADLIAAIRTAFGSHVAAGALHFSDDAAVLPPVALGATRVITTDVVVEGVDFDRALYPPHGAGFRALAQNASDLAAMGARPVGFVWALCIPLYWSDTEVDGFVAGAAEAAHVCGLPLLGGDLSATTGPMTASITALGDCARAPLLRSAAEVGDIVCVSRPLGASAAGLRLLRAAAAASGAQPPSARSVAGHAQWLASLPQEARDLVLAHVRPVAEVALGQQLAGVAHACMDVSDGLLIDAHRLAAASSVRVALGTLTSAVAPGATTEDALSGGEDYALLFTAPPAGVPAGARVIGRVEAGSGVTLEGTAVAPRGFDHFVR